MFLALAQYSLRLSTVHQGTQPTSRHGDPLLDRHGPNTE